MSQLRKLSRLVSQPPLGYAELRLGRRVVVSGGCRADLSAVARQREGGSPAGAEADLLSRIERSVSFG